jgi:phosphonopyruvate decarboxylase
MMQNSGLGNAVNPIASLAYIFRIPALLIVTLRGEVGHEDEPQHELMGVITGGILDQLRVPWEYFPEQSADIAPALERAMAHLEREERPYAFIMRKGSVASHRLSREENAAAVAGRHAQPVVDPSVEVSKRPTRSEALQRVIELTSPANTVVIATTGYTGRELWALADRPNHLYVVGSMGCASSLGLGLSLVRPDLKVVVLDGDGAALMRMGNFAMAGAYGRPNFVHVVLDNATYDSTGGQGTVSPIVSFATVASACGYGIAREGDELRSMEEVMQADGATGPRFVRVRIRPGTMDNLPRPTQSPYEVSRRLMTHLGTRGEAPEAIHIAERTA